MVRLISPMSQRLRMRLEGLEDRTVDRLLSEVLFHAHAPTTAAEFATIRPRCTAAHFLILAFPTVRQRKKVRAFVESTTSEILIR